jgi:uracil-DNA glycosylase
LPMGFCYPGKGSSGDLPPRTECAPAWREPLLECLDAVELTIVIGQYAMAYHLPGPSRSVTEQVQSWAQYWPNLVPLPHPSPRNNRWLVRNPWFEIELLPKLRERVSEVLAK